MKITFVGFMEESLGLEYLSAVLKQNGHTVELVFDPCLFNDNLVDIDFLRNFFDYQDEVIKKICFSRSSLVVFSVFSDHYRWFKRMASRLKAVLNVPIVVGGVHASSVPEIVIQEAFVDYLIVGEGEYPLLHLVEFLEGKRNIIDVPNLWYKTPDGVKSNKVQPLIPSLDSLPFPDKNLFYDQMPFYQNHYFIAASRGCCFNCSYCCHSVYKNIYPSQGYFRMRSPQNVIDELVQAKQKYKIDSVYFTDDIFATDVNWLEEFVPLYKNKINIPYKCLLHPGMVTERIVELLKESLCFKVEMGIQTINPGLRAKICNRDESTEKIEKSIKLLMDNGIRVYTQTIIALPGENEEHLKEAVLFFSRVKITFNFFFVLRYYPRTQIVSFAKEHKIIDDDLIKKIEHGELAGALTSGGSLLDKTKQKYYNLLVLCNLLPKNFIRFLLEKNRIKYIPLIIPMKFSILFIFFIYRKSEFFSSQLKLFRFNRDIARYRTYMIKKFCPIH